MINGPPDHKVNETVTSTRTEPQPPTKTKAHGKRKEVVQVGPSSCLHKVILTAWPAH